MVNRSFLCIECQRFKLKEDLWQEHLDSRPDLRERMSGLPRCCDDCYPKLMRRVKRQVRIIVKKIEESD